MSESDDENELEQEARIALLQYYSSKSTLQATIVLSLVIAFFASLEAISILKLTWLYSLSFATFAFFTIRAFGRLVYWGNLTGTVLYVDFTSEIEGQETIKKVNEKLEKEKVSFKPTYLLRLEQPSERHTEKLKLYLLFRLFTNWFPHGWFPLPLITYGFLLSSSLLPYIITETVYLNLAFALNYVLLATYIIIMLTYYYTKYIMKRK